MVRLYTLRDDVSCHRIRKFLNSKHISFTEIDVRKNGITGYLERDLGAHELPVAVTSSGIFVGEEEIKKHL